MNVAVTKLREHWDETNSKVMQRKTQLDMMLGDSKEYEAKRNAVEVWLSRMETRLERMRAVGHTADVLAMQLEEQKVRSYGASFRFSASAFLARRAIASLPSSSEPFLANFLPVPRKSVSRVDSGRETKKKHWARISRPNIFHFRSGSPLRSPLRSVQTASKVSNDIETVNGRASIKLPPWQIIGVHLEPTNRIIAKRIVIVACRGSGVKGVDLRPESQVNKCSSLASPFTPLRV